MFFLMDRFLKCKERKLYFGIQKFKQKTCPGEDEEENRKKNIRRLRRERRNFTKKCLKYFICAMVYGLSAISLLVIKVKSGGDSSPVKTSQDMLNEIFSAAGGVVGNCDPTQIINAENKRTEEEVVTALFKEGLFFSLYEEAPKTKSERKQIYVKFVDDLMGAKGTNNLIMDNGISRTEKTGSVIYSENIEQLDKIENSKVPAGYTREDVEKGLVMPLTVGADIYLWEYELRWQCYVINPTNSMLQQTAKAAEDAAILLSTDDSRVVEMVECAGYAVTHYLCLARFDWAGESKADCCYWMAKLFCILSESLPKEWEDMIEHCKLMSFAFCEKGVDFLLMLDEKNDHENELLQLRDKMDLQTVGE